MSSFFFPWSSPVISSALCVTHLRSSLSLGEGINWKMNSFRGAAFGFNKQTLGNFLSRVFIRKSSLNGWHEILFILNNSENSGRGDFFGLETQINYLKKNKSLQHRTRKDLILFLKKKNIDIQIFMKKRMVWSQHNFHIFIYFKSSRQS